MADERHVERFREGVDAWNQWRRENPRLEPDLSGAVLSDPARGWSVWEQTVVTDLEGIDLSRANLRRCLLRGARLPGADLRRADLMGADLRRADLSGADLNGARLAHANLTLANLRGATLKNALFWETVLARVCLAGARSLDACRHGGPSVVDHRTIRRSPGVPDAFWRGCGLPDAILDAFRTQAAREPAKPSVFISYSTDDSAFATKLYEDLQAHAVECWMAEHDLKAGIGLEDQIDAAIGEHDRAAVILSESSMRSAWVLTELQRARDRERHEQRDVLLPLRLVSFAALQTWKCFDSDAGEDVAKAIRRYHIPDFSGWRDDSIYRLALERLIAGLGELAARERLSPPRDDG